MASAHHERSETIEIDGRFFNVNGHTRRPLKPRFPFERPSYSTLAEAVRSARRRSDAIGEYAIKSAAAKAAAKSAANAARR